MGPHVRGHGEHRDVAELQALAPRTTPSKLPRWLERVQNVSRSVMIQIQGVPQLLGRRGLLPQCTCFSSFSVFDVLNDRWYR